MHFLGNREEAEDVTQEVLMRFWKNRDALHGGQPLGWLLRVTRNAAIDALRKRKTYHKSIQSDNEQVDRSPDLKRSPENQAIASDVSRHVQEAISQLEEPYRSLIILREIQELKYQEVADIMDLPLNTVKVYLHRGRKMLRNELSEVLLSETT